MLLPYIKQNLEPVGEEVIVTPEPQRDGDAGRLTATRNNRRAKAREVAEAILALTDVKKPVREVARRVTKYLDAPEGDAAGLAQEVEAQEAALQAEVATNRMASRWQDPATLEVLAQLDALTRYMKAIQEDEESILVLLLD